MPIGIIEINDAGLRYIDDEQKVLESPGFAVVNGKELLLGEPAIQQSRLQPLNTNTQFWHRLSAEPLPAHNPQYRHHADLAYSQLLDLHQQNPRCDRVIFALPASFTRDQMSLLLGIAGQCPFSAIGLVDSAVAAASGAVTQAQACLVELQLHQVVFTRLFASSQVKREAVEVLPRSGLLALRDKWAKFLADQFIEQCRFDPLHSAATEQALYDRLPGWLQLAREESDLFLEVAGKTAKISRAEFLRPVRDLYQLITGKAQQLAGSGEVIISDRFAQLPGFAIELSHLSTPARLLESYAVLNGTRANIEAITSASSNGLSFVQSLPLARPINTASAIKPTTTSPPQERTPTHLLVGSSAWPLTQAPMYLQANGDKPIQTATASSTRAQLRSSSDGFLLIPVGQGDLALNGSAVTDNVVLRVGDEIQFAGLEPFRLIKVFEAHGS